MKYFGPVAEALDVATKGYVDARTMFGVCGTTGATQAKTVTIDGVTELFEGLAIRVKFSNAQTYNGAPTLTVNGIGPATIARGGTTSAGRYEWAAGEVLTLVYTGSRWVICDGWVATTTYYGVTKLSNSTSSTSTAMAATPYAVKLAYDLANGKQDALTFDTTPTENSANPVTSGGVYSALLSVASGVTFTPSVSETGVLSWTNDGGLPNPASVDIAAAVLSRLPNYMEEAW